MLHLPLLALLAAPAASTVPDPAEVKIVAYLKTNVKPGERVVVSDLYNKVFTAPDERAALNRLFNTFFKIPLFAAQYQKGTGKAPSLEEISEQFRFDVPGETDVMLRILESDPRVPKFLQRNADSGQIERVDVDAILQNPRFGKALERTITGWEGKNAPAFSTKTYDGTDVASASLTGKPHVVYFWFSNCPPCMKTAPLLAELHKAYAAKGFEVVAANTDRVLEVKSTDADRAAYAKNIGDTWTLVHTTPEMQEAYGAVSVFPTLFFVDKKGVIVKHFVNFQEKSALESALKLTLE
jgi:thiol-disulfide isomerase/thioredoxin